MSVISGGAIGGTAGGSVDLSTTVILTPTSSTRNVITPGGNYVPLSIRAANGQTVSVLEFWNNANTSSLKILLDQNGTGYQDILASQQIRIGTGSGGGTGCIVINANGNMSISPSNVIPNIGINNTGATFGIPIVFSSTAYVGIGNNDVGLKYSASGILKVTNGSTGYGSLILGAYSASTIGLTVKGYTSQTANLQEWQDSAGTVLGYVNASGGLKINGVASDIVLATDGTHGVYIGNFTTLQIQLRTQSILIGNNCPIYLDSDGGGSGRCGLSRESTNVIRSYNGTTYGGFRCGAPDASTQGLIIKGYTSQTANLSEWQNSSGTVLTRVDKNGTLVTKVNSAPADGDLAANECSIWFDSSNGASKLKIKGKSADGTVVSGEVALA